MNNNQLLPILIKHISESGPISFHDYMEAALYYPDLGYYMAKREKIGPCGDFFTSCSLGPIFGAMIAKQVAEMWQLSGENHYTIVEYGAGDGMLCHDIIDYFQNETDLYNKLRYVIIEKSPFMCEKGKVHLPKEIVWCDSIDELGEFTGCVISNELLDNFAVHRVVMQDVLMEVFVDYQSELVEILRPANPELVAYFADLGIKLPNGYSTEINLQARQWLTDIARKLRKGFVLTIDYGYFSKELYRQSHCQGTIMCYYKHQLCQEYYQEPGSRDITSHVNFSDLCKWGELLGLSYCGLTSQAEFLLALDFKTHLRKLADETGDIMHQAMQEHKLTRTLLIDMGSKFKVLVQQKGVTSIELSGLKSFRNSTKDEDLVCRGNA